MAKVVYTLAQALAKIAGGAEFAQEATVSFGFFLPSTSYYGATTNLNEGQKVYAREAMTAWDDVSKLHFSETTSANSANIKMYNVANASFAGAQLGNQIMLSSNYSYMLNQTHGGYGLMATIHEIGHSLGLDHPGAYNGGAPTYAKNALFMQDSRQYTVMSYFDASNTGAYHGGYYASTPLLYDIAAIQKLYGADMTTRAGDTVYGFNSTAGREAFDFTVDTHPIICIWDGGGNDTIDLSGFGNTQVVDLHAGSFSDVGGLTKNVSIAFGASVENAVGGSGNDTMIGNALNNVLSGGAGNDTINGDLGADTMNGGLGNDIFVIDNTGDRANELFGQGTDTVMSSITFTLSDNLENLTLLGTAALNGTGNGLDNTLIGNAGANILNGGAGNDTMYGGLGNDTYIVDATGDRVSEALNQGTDTVYASATFTLSDNVENLILSGTAAVNGTGNALANVITGNAADNVLKGGVGLDTLVGGEGNDTLFGQAGNDTLTGGLGADTFCFDTASVGGKDTIKDFNLAQGDKLNIHDLLINLAGHEIGGFVHLTASGTNTLLMIDRDGSGSAYSFVQYATLEHTSALNVQTMFGAGNLIG